MASEDDKQRFIPLSPDTAGRYGCLERGCREGLCSKESMDLKDGSTLEAVCSPLQKSWKTTIVLSSDWMIIWGKTQESQGSQLLWSKI